MVVIIVKGFQLAMRVKEQLSGGMEISMTFPYLSVPISFIVMLIFILNHNLVKEIHRRFSEWFAKVLEHLNQMDFDFYVVADDLADSKAPWMSPNMFREFFLPCQRIVADTIKKPWVL
jgi:hypothetical protein